MRPRDSENAPFNPVFWAALAVFWGAIGFLHSRKVYPAGGPSFWLAFSSVELRALVAMGLAVLLGGMLKRRFGRLGELLPPAAFLVLTTLHQAAALSFFFLDQPLPAVIRYLSSRTNMSLWAMLENLGLSDRTLAAVLAGMAAAIGLGLALLTFSQRLAARKNWRLRTGSLLGACYAAAALILFEQYLSGRIKNPEAWHREQQTSPLYVPLWRPHGFAAYAATLTPPQGLDAPPTSVPPVAKNANALLIVLESFRSDCIDPEMTPNLYRFQKENLSFTRAFANGNATALAWPAIIDSEYPVFANAVHGSPALAILKKAGFRNAVFASMGVEFLNFRGAAFGPGDTLAEVVVAPGLYKPESDRLSAQRLLRDFDARPSGRNFRILFLNATHSPYRWPADFKAKYGPVLSVGVEDHGALVEGANGMGAIDVDNAEAVVRFRNRYKNSVNFIDGLFGEIVSGLKARGLYENAAIVVVGDHGQEFMEHGTFTHGTNLFNPQIHIPLIMKLPLARRPSTEVLASQVDIMPTLLDYFGLGEAAKKILAGRSLIGKSGEPRSVLTENLSASDPETRSWALSTGGYKVAFDLPAASGLLPLVVWGVTDSEDKPFVPGKGTPVDYEAFLDREFVPPLNKTGAIVVLRR